MEAAILTAALTNLAVAAALAGVAFVVGRWPRWAVVAHAAWLLVLIKLLTPSPATFAALARTTDTGLIWPTVVLGAWLAGSCAWAGVAALRVRRFARLLRFATHAPAGVADDVAEAARRIGLKHPPRVRVLPGGVAPLVWAVGRPTVFLPAALLGRLSADQRLTLLAHELAHLRRGDHIVRWIESVALAVWWWCPLAWLARRELRRLEEEACDAEVAAAFPGSGHAYAAAILDAIDLMAGVVVVPPLANGLGDAASLRRRLTLVLDGQTPVRTSGPARLGLAVVALAILAVGPMPADAVQPVKPTPRVRHCAPRTMPPSPQPPAVVVHEPTRAVAEPAPPTPVRRAVPASRRGEPCRAAALSASGERLALADGAEVVVCDPTTGRTLATLAGHTGTVAAVAFSPDGSRLATAAQDGLVKLWDAATGRELRTLAGHANWASAVAFAPDGRTLVSGGYDRAVRRWDATTGQLVATWTGHTGGVRAVAFSPDGQRVASGGADNEVRLWDATTGSSTAVVKWHEAAVRALAFSPDGERLASGSEDRTVRLWQTADGREAGPPVTLPDFVTALAFAPRGTALFAGTFGGHLFDIDANVARPREPAHADAVTAIATTNGVPVSVSQDRTVLAWPTYGSPRFWGLTLTPAERTQP